MSKDVKCLRHKFSTVNGGLMLKLKELRNAKGMTGEELGRAIGVSAPTIYNWEAERVNMTIAQACSICDVLGCTLDQLAGRERRADGTWHVADGIYGALNSLGQEKLVEYAEDLTANPKYTSVKSSRADTSA